MTGQPAEWCENIEEWACGGTCVPLDQEVGICGDVVEFRFNV